MNSRYIVPLLGVSALAFACGPRQHTEASATSRPVAMSAPARYPTKAVQKQRDGAVESRLVVLKSGNALRFALQVANAGSKRIELAFADGQTHDIVVVDSVGRQVWKWGEGRYFTQVMRTHNLGGGDTLKLSETWERPRAHGTLTAIATLRSQNYPVQQRVSFVMN